MSRADRFALIISLLAILGAFLVTELVFEGMAHIEDEMAYVWQAKAISEGYLTIPSPPHPKSFLVPFVVDYNGRRFGKYPLGWPVVLAIGIKLGIRNLVNPLLGGFGVWLIYRLGKKTLGESAGALAALLTATSPFFLMNSGSLLSHPMGLVLSTGFGLAWLDTFTEPDQKRRWLTSLVAGGTLGLLALTRPLTAIAVGLPFAVHGCYLLWRGNRHIRKYLLTTGILALVLGSLHFLWQYALTGDAFLNPYTLWWEYDKVGFGPGHGHLSTGHTLLQARINTMFSLRTGWHDLFGWGSYSWIFLPAGAIAIRKKGRIWLIVSVFPSLVLVYLSYWIGASLFGPRYYYEGIYSLTILSAAGIAWLAGWPLSPKGLFPNYRGWKKVRPLAITALLVILLSANLLYYTPLRVGGMQGLYGVQSDNLKPFLTEDAQELTPALVVVHTSGKWIEYGTLLELENPFLNTPFIFVVSRSPEINAEIAAQFPDRRVLHYYPDTPYTFYTAPRPPQ